MDAIMEERPEPSPTYPTKPLIYQLSSTQTDDELRAIEWILTILGPLPPDTQVRALTYIGDRVESDHDALTRPEAGPADVPVTTGEVAQVLAESDGRDWSVMSAVDRSPYFRRAGALEGAGVVVLRRP